MNAATASAIDGFVTAVSAALVALFGFNYYAMVWAFVGALVALMKSEQLAAPVRAIFYVLFSTFIGALLGTAAGELFHMTTRSAIAIMSLLGGVGWQGIIAILLKVAEGKLRTYVPPRGDEGSPAP